MSGSTTTCWDSTPLTSSGTPPAGRTGFPTGLPSARIGSAIGLTAVSGRELRLDLPGTQRNPPSGSWWTLEADRCGNRKRRATPGSPVDWHRRPDPGPGAGQFCALPNRRVLDTSLEGRTPPDSLGHPLKVPSSVSVVSLDQSGKSQWSLMWSGFNLNPTRDAFCSYPSNRPYRSQIHQETQPETGHDPVLAEPLKGPALVTQSIARPQADAVVKRRPGLLPARIC